MNKTALVLLFLLFSASFSYAQFTFTVKAKINNKPITSDTIQACVGTPIKFYVEFTPQYATVDTFETIHAKYYWVLDNSRRVSGTGKDTVEYAFKNGGGYYVYLKVTDIYDTARVVITPVKIALNPNFSGTKSVPESPVCLGEHLTLTGQVRPPLWEYTVPQTYENVPTELSYENPIIYQKAIYHGSFPANSTLDSAEAIKRIAIKLNHPNLGDLSIRLKCPNDSIFLKLKSDASVDTADLGIPPSENALKGIAYEYSWTPSPTFGRMTEKAKDLQALPEGSYTPDEELTKLKGCELNGDWVLEVIDSVKNNNLGYISGWKLEFVDAILPKKRWTYENTYIKDSCIWSGDTTEATLKTYITKDRIWKGIALAQARSEGENAYTYHVYDNFMCPQDTLINVNVTRASLLATPLTGDAPLTVKFDNQTEWAKTIKWDFDDNNKTSSQDTISYIYTHKDTFHVVLLVKSEGGCIDTARTSVVVKFPTSKILLPNVFTPNDDGVGNFVVVPEDQDAKGKNLADLFTEFDCSVYDRWGRRVFHTKDPNDVDKSNGGWDGTLHDNGGRKIAPGVYFYIVIGKGKDGETRKVAGSLTVF